MIITSLVMIILCYCCCCKCCKRRFQNFFKWWKDKIINSVYYSRECLRIPNTKANSLRKPSLEDAIEETELMSLKACNKQMIPSGKR